jgi:hypothetical protein
VESSCELGNDSSGSIKCWELPNGCTTCGLSSGTELHRVSYVSASQHEVAHKEKATKVSLTTYEEINSEFIAFIFGPPCIIKARLRVEIELEHKLH